MKRSVYVDGYYDEGKETDEVESYLESRNTFDLTSQLQRPRWTVEGIT
jgi:hypothetical protein